MANPKVNVLIANHNYGEWIMDAVNSAIDQTYPDISITIVDDLSTDDSWMKIYKNLFQSRPHNKILPSDFDIRTCTIAKNGRDIPVTAIRLNKNSGPSTARNIGISYTLEQSDFYMILDADDIMQPNKVYRCVEEAMKLPGIIGIVYGDYTTLNVENGLERIEYKPDFNIEHLYQECIIHSGSLVSKEALLFARDQFGFYDERMRVAEDYDLWFRITKKYSAVHIPESLTTVRVTPKNSTNQVDIDTRNACHMLMRNKLQGQQ